MKTAFPDATIIKASQLFGPEDKLLNWFAIAARALPFIPMPNEGESLSKPVYMGDVAKAIAKMIGQYRGTRGKTYVLEGNDDYTYSELASFVYDITTQTPAIPPLPNSVVKGIGSLMGKQPNPLFTEDQVELWSTDYLYSGDYEGVRTFKDLDIEPTPMEKEAFRYLHQYKPGGHFAMVDTYVGHVDSKK